MPNQFKSVAETVEIVESELSHFGEDIKADISLQDFQEKITDIMHHAFKSVDPSEYFALRKQLQFIVCPDTIESENGAFKNCIKMRFFY